MQLNHTFEQLGFSFNPAKIDFDRILINSNVHQSLEEHRRLGSTKGLDLEGNIVIETSNKLWAYLDDPHKPVIRFL